MSFILSKFKRSGTRANFGSTDKRTLPSASTAPVTTQTVSTSEETKEREDTDRRVEKAEERDERADERDVPTSDTKDKGKVKSNVAVSRARTHNTTSAQDAFTKFWSGMQSYSLHPITFSTTAWWVPNALPLLVLCNIAVPLVARSNWIMKNETTFFPYAVITALCYIYYIQILRAREAAGELTGRESSTLTRFRKLVKEEKVIIPGPFVPYFYNIVATQLEDRKYDWVVPSYGDLSDFLVAGGNSAATFSNLNFIRPIIPHMLALMATFGSMDQPTMDARLDEERIFTAVALDRAADTNIFDRDIDFHTNAAPQAANRWLMACGTSTPIQFWNDNANTARQHLARSQFFGVKTGNTSTTGIDITAIPGQRLPNNRTRDASTQKDCHLIDSFLFLEKDKNANWSKYMFEQLEVFSKHFTGNKNLSEMPTTGGMETSILCELRTPTQHTGNRYVYDDSNLGLALRTDIDWYPNRFDQLSGYFRSTRADITREEELQALCFAPNALPPIHNIYNERNLFRDGHYFDHMNGATEAHDLMELGSSASTTKGQVELFQGWNSDVVRQMYRAKPSDV